MKKNYIAPETNSVKLDSGRLICNSDFTKGDRESYGEAIPLTW